MSHKERIWLDGLGRVKRGERTLMAAAELVGLSVRRRGNPRHSHAGVANDTVAGMLAGMEGLIVLVILAAVLLLPLIWVIANYNRMTRFSQHIRESWSGIDVEMKRRYELIPNLVATVKGYAAHEREVLEKVIELRNRAMANHGSAASQAVDESTLMIEMKRLFALAEGYPQLKADAHFLALQKELAHTEDRIAAARRFYNGNVREMNQLCQVFPTNLLASAFGFSGGSYFELDSEAERAVPRVEV